MAPYQQFWGHVLPHKTVEFDNYLQYMLAYKFAIKILQHLCLEGYEGAAAFRVSCSLLSPKNVLNLEENIC